MTVLDYGLFGITHTYSALSTWEEQIMKLVILRDSHRAHLLIQIGTSDLTPLNT
jgi:hypothetical protein